MTPPIESLYNRSWITNSRKILFLTMYIPMGTLIFTMRIFMSLQLLVASTILPRDSNIRRFLLRIFYGVMGIFVREENKISIPDSEEKPRLIVANHLTPFDHVAFNLVNPCCAMAVYKLPKLVSSVLGYEDFSIAQGKEATKRNICAYMDKKHSLPVMLHPEGATTNGQVALMKYANWAFEMDDRVLVVAIKVNRLPFLPISATILGASWPSDLFFTLFSPVTIFTIKYIDIMTKGADETTDLFAKRAQTQTAKALQLDTTNYSVGDKMEYLKRRMRENNNNPMNNPEVHTMALRVRDVLPHVPLDIIKRDLLRSRSVDTTITNIIEGNIREPIPAASVTERQPPPVTSSVKTSDHCNAASKSFAQSSDARTMSFEERKNELIASARAKYLRKHKIDLC